MQRELSPGVITVLAVIVIVLLGFLFWKGAEGRTFTKDSVSGGKAGLPTLMQPPTR